jgi:hypothetical protein
VNEKPCEKCLNFRPIVQFTGLKNMCEDTDCRGGTVWRYAKFERSNGGKCGKSGFRFRQKEKENEDGN